jgi:hypothetical protein
VKDLEQSSRCLNKQRMPRETKEKNGLPEDGVTNTETRTR